MSLAELKIVRLIYFDEAGSSQDEIQEPIITVASVLLHGDLQTGPIEQEAEGIIADLVPGELRRNFEFHGKELFSGSDKLKGWPRDERYAALRAFMELVSKHNLPVHAISIVKEGFWKSAARLEKDGLSRETHPYILHEAAFMNCAIAVEAWFRHNAQFERGFCVADETKARNTLKNNFRELRKDSTVFATLEIGSDNGRLDHLIDTIYFGDSRESIFLQLADCCAYFIKRTVMGRADAEPFYKIIEQQVAPKPLRLLFQYS
jgi:hypothetical protein